MYRQVGIAAKGVALCFTDKEIKEEGFLEYINIFLNTGELPTSSCVTSSTRSSTR